MVARKKPSKPPEHRWQISLIKATPAKYLGSVYAPDEGAAIEAAAREFKIDDTLKDRLVARRDQKGWDNLENKHVDSMGRFVTVGQPKPLMPLNWRIPPLGTNSCGSALMPCQSAMNAMTFENKASKHLLATCAR